MGSIHPEKSVDGLIRAARFAEASSGASEHSVTIGSPDQLDPAPLVDQEPTLGLIRHQTDAGTGARVGPC